MASPDLLGELCVAVEKDAEQENRTLNGSGRAVAVPERGKPGDHPVARSLETKVVSPLDALVAMYKTACETEGDKPCEEHVQLLASIPGELVMDVRMCSSRLLYGTSGGAVLRVSSGSPEQLCALLTTIAPPPHAGAMVLVDTLDLTGVRVGHEALAAMLDNALLWGPWWRLRCLVLRDCGLTPIHIHALGRLETVPCLWNLEVLDLSDNASVGKDLVTGAVRGPAEYAGADVAFLVYLWKQSKLRRVSFKGCGLETGVTACMLKVLRSYYVPSEQGMECGVLMHGGSRLFLECLELGTCDDAIVDTIAAVLSALPNVRCIEVDGLSDDARRRLSELMKLREDFNGTRRRDDSVDDDSNDGAHGEASVGLGEMDSTNTPSTVFCTSSFDASILQPPKEHVMPSRESEAGLSALDRDLSHPKLPQQLLDDFGLNEIILQEDSRANHASEGDGEVVLKATRALDSYGLNLVSPRRIAAARQPCKKQRRERGGDFGEETHLARDTEIRSDVYRNGDNDDDDDTDDTDDNETSSSDLGPRKLDDQINNFKMRDGALDEDSRLGRIFRATAKKNIASLPKKKQKAARRAFGLWDQCTENSWDRRRWTNPSRTQNDSPEILGQLNLLFDILHEEGLEFGFPFPMWRRGKGARAFLPLEEEVMEEPAKEVAFDSSGSSERQRKKKKKKALVESESDSE